MQNSFERKFVVSPEGNAEEVELTEEEKKQCREKEKNKGKYLGIAQDRKFVVDQEGGVAMEGDNKEKIAVKRRDGSVEKFVS